MSRGPQVLAVAVLALLATACGGTDVVRQAVPGTGASGGPAPQEEAGDEVPGSDWTVRQAGPRELVVSLVAAPAGDGPCDSRLRAVAQETPTQVRLSVVDDNPRPAPAGGGPVVCPAIGYQWSLPVTLADDLGSRALVRSDGAPLTASTALEPARLPPGYVLASESGSGGLHSLTYLSPDGGWLVVSTHAEDVSAAERAFRQTEERVVDGRTFRLLENELQKVVAFQQDGRAVWVSWMLQRVDSTAATTWDELLEVAVSVR